MSVLYVVGTGPGSISLMTEEARDAIGSATVIVGYDNYIEQVRPLLDGKRIIATGMMKEVDRCRQAIDTARSGETVALISGGDAGIYGMAGLILELADQDNDDSPEIRIIPGLSAIQSAASLLGAPVMHDFAVISLSDLLTPWPVIVSRLEAAARADFVVALYNPRSKGRTTHIEDARRILLARRGPATPVGIVRHASRPDQSVVVSTLDRMLENDIDMSTIVIIGNSATFVDRRGRMVTPRGYHRKYDAVKHQDTSPTDTTPNPRSVMFCGTASDVGKSVLAAGLCRLLVRRGLTVAPFKSQNMSLNSCVTPEGGEIGRAQGVQAQACRIPPHTDMNPILLKPSSDTGSQVIIQGKAVGNMNVSSYDTYKPQALTKAAESFERLRGKHDFIVIEGAGSISEINLKHNDIANLAIARMAGCPVILVADIERGGVFAQIVGTIELLDPEERAQIAGIIINRFRGDASILASGLDYLRQRTGIPLLGVVPWLRDLNLPAEDSLSLPPRDSAFDRTSSGKIRIGVIRLPRISNFTDFDELMQEPDVALCYIDTPQQLDGLDLLIIPGSKSTISDLHVLDQRGFREQLLSFTGRIAGICGGFQMLGQRIIDPLGVESSEREAAGLGLLPVTTELLAEKQTHLAQCRLTEAGLELAPGCSEELHGYEIHMGETRPVGDCRHLVTIRQRGNQAVTIDDGAISADGRVFGTYLHGLFSNPGFRTAYLNTLRREKGLAERSEAGAPAIDPFDRLADHLEQHLDMATLYRICGLEP